MRSSSISTMRSLLTISSSAIPIPHHHHHHHHFRLLLPFKRTTLPLPPTSAATFPSVLRSHCSLPAASCRYSSMELRPAAPGEIHVIIGPMFAGKTTGLLRRIRAELASGRTAAIIKSDKDTRYGLDSAVTHDGSKMPCFALPELSMFKDKFGTQAYNELDVIGIDEAQFFEDLYDFCRTAADRDGKTVVVAGLDGDYLRRRFGSVLDIIPLADSVTKLTARCELCGCHAFFTLRKTSETKTELIGGADVYMPVCRQHYIDGQVAIETTKIVLSVERSAVVGNMK